MLGALQASRFYVRVALLCFPMCGEGVGCMRGYASWRRGKRLSPERAGSCTRGGDMLRKNPEASKTRKVWVSSCQSREINVRGENGVEARLKAEKGEGRFEECTEGDAGAGH